MLDENNISTKRVAPEWHGNSKIAIVGEAPGEEEEIKGIPFVGPSGRFLNHCLYSVGIDRKQCLVTNVFGFRPLNNNVDLYFIKRRDFKKLKLSSPYPAYKTAGYVKEKYINELSLLKQALEVAKPNVAIALGAVALWALTGLDKIGIYRGSVIESTLVPGLKVLPTYHPSAILKTYENKPYLMQDLRKALRESAYPEIRRTVRTVYIEPTLDDLLWYYDTHIVPAPYISPDIETMHNQITAIGIATSPTVTMVIPFYDPRKDDNSYWSFEEEVYVMQWLARILGDSTKPKLFQNGNYDVTFLAEYGIYVKGPYEDTMLLHHALQPELNKSLLVLGSLYSDEIAWKAMAPHRKRSKDEIEKEND